MGLQWDRGRTQGLLCPRLGHIIPGPNLGQPPLFLGIRGQAGPLWGLRVGNVRMGPLPAVFAAGDAQVASPVSPAQLCPGSPQGTAACGGHVLQADPTQNSACCSVLSKAPPHAAPRGAHGGSRRCRRGCTEGSLLHKVRAQQVPVCSRVCACECMCVPPVRVCVCVCVRRPCATAARGTHRPPRGGTGTCPGRRGGGGGRQPDAGDREGKRGSSVRTSAGGQTERRSGSGARCTERGHSPVRERGTGGQSPAGGECPERGRLVGSQGHRSPQGVSDGFGKVGRAVGRGRARWDDPVRRGRCRVQGTGAAQSGGSAPRKRDSPGGVPAPKVARFG